jgi:Ser/Thr protein kinase RdoA (MazF antagonist)
MEAYMRDQMTEDILKKAAVLYKLSRDTISFLGGFENFVYQVNKPDQAYILRLVHSNHRSYNEVLAELEFIDYLAHNGACVSTVIHSKQDHIVEQLFINKTEYFSVSVFEKAPGTYVKDIDKTPIFWEHFGVEVGRLHRLTKDFKPIHKRREWDQEDIEDLAERHLEEDDKEVVAIYRSLKKQIMTYPKHHDNYGLIHTDLHFHNMYYHDHQLTFFDFDDCTYMHFVSDIAIVIYYSFQHLVVGEHSLDKEDYNKQVKAVFSDFMNGYFKENHLAKEDLQHINTFLQFRAALLYIVLVASGFKYHKEEGYRKFCMHQKERALRNLMALDVDYLLEGIL